jgi:hypothetical protein
MLARDFEIPRTAIAVKEGGPTYGVSIDRCKL